MIALDAWKRLEQIKVQAPLARSVLWCKPEADYDQRRSVIAAMKAPTVCLVQGGERSGKSLGMKWLTLAMALGADEPQVQHWLRLNRLPRDVIPREPGEVYVLASKSGDSVRYHRPDFKELVGSIPHKWINPNAKGEASLEINVSGHRRPAKIWFLSVGQGPEAMQGASLRWVWIDEEPLGEVGRAVYRHLRGRVMDQDGRIAISFWPSQGITWVHDDLVRDRQDDAVVVYLDALDNPHNPAARAARHFGSMSAEEQASRRFGRFQRREGTIYDFREGVDEPDDETEGGRWGPFHVCDDFEIPADWPRFRGDDFGQTTNGTGSVWIALGDDNTRYVYREYYLEEEPSFVVHAQNVRAVQPADEELSGAWGDPAAAEGRKVYNAHGLGTDLADNDVAGGISRCADTLRLVGHRPRFKVFRSCRRFLQEIRGYRRDPKLVSRAPLKVDDHLMDAWRYAEAGIQSYGAQRQGQEKRKRAIRGLLNRLGR